MKSRRTSAIISLTPPDVSLVHAISDLGKKLGIVFSTITDAIATRLPGRGKFSFSLPSFGRRGLPSLSFKRFIPIAILALIVIAITVAVGMKVAGSAKPDQRVQVQGAKATMAINKEYAFPLTDSTGKEISKLKYFIESADLRDEIIVQGQRAVAVKGRTFMVVTVKLTNDYDKPINVNVRDYVRLSVNGNETELLAADIHNDPVTIQAISTKYTRIGFPIDDTAKNLVLLVGEIKGNKEKLPLTFK